MKRLVIASVILLVFSISANAQMGMMSDQKSEMKQKGTMSEGMKPMMEMCMPMMKQMMGQGMMMQDMMRMMQDMMKMQKRMMMGMKPDNKKEMTTELDGMMENMNKMMSDMRLMMMQKCMEPSAAEPKKGETKEVPAPKSEPHKH